MPKVLKAMGQAIATTIGTWVVGSKLVGNQVHMYVDAVEWKSAYLVGVGAEDAGARLWKAPPMAWNQQAAELHGVEKAVKRAAYRGMKELNLDNLATVWAMLKRRLKIHHRERTTVDTADTALERAGVAAHVRAFKMEPGGLHIQYF